MSDNRKVLGESGEEFAARILEQDGYTILERNYRCASGEIDIIASRKNIIYFIEVKTRRSCIYGTPAEAVTPRKQAHIRTSAIKYLKEKNMRGKRFSFQVVEIVFNQIKDAF